MNCWSLVTAKTDSFYACREAKSPKTVKYIPDGTVGAISIWPDDVTSGALSKSNRVLGFRFSV